MKELSIKEQSKYLPKVLPSGWEYHAIGDTFLYDNYYSFIRVMANVSIEDDGNRWMHISVSRNNGKMPDWFTMLSVKDLFAGKEALALQVFPPKSEHYTSGMPVDVAHLWICLDKRPVPDFLKARGGTI